MHDDDDIESVVRHVVDALGGYEGGAYQMGDRATGCLRDLKKLWRRDDDDDERTVARIFWRSRVLPNDLVPILLATAGAGHVQDARAIACADLVAAMTWPIDVAEELRELDETEHRGVDYTQLVLSHLHYKAALLEPGVMHALFAIMLPPLAKPARERSDRDAQIVSLVLHLVRNLAFIKDPPPDMHKSADRAEHASLQSRLVKALSETHTLDLLLTIAANDDRDPLFHASNTLVLEIFQLLFRGVKPTALALDQTKPAQTLHRLLAAEDKKKRDVARSASSRHSRFGTTIAVRLKPLPSSKPLVLHRQAAITHESGSVLDMTKHRRAHKPAQLDELARDDALSYEARLVLQGFAKELLRSCFNPFLASLLKDIRSERPKITEKDHLRLLYATKWLLAFFLDLHAHDRQRWTLGLVAEVTDRSWIVWVLKRMREAMEDKPKSWNELQAGIDCLTQLLLLIDAMSLSVISDPDLDDAARLLKQQLIYNGDVLDIAFDSLRSYKQGTQSLAFLDSSVHLAYALLRMLERWAKEHDGAAYVRKKAAKRRKPKGESRRNGVSEAEEDEDEGVPDVEDEDEADAVHETMFTFEALEMKFAHAEITRTLLVYLSRYPEFDSPEPMKRVVSLIQRQVVRAKAEGLYFNVSTLHLFKSILDDQRSLPKDAPYRDLVRLITFILRKFFESVQQEPFLMMEAWYPMNRGHWKQYSSWEPEQKANRGRGTVEDEVEVEKGYSWSEQIGIAVAALVEQGKSELVEWVKDILVLVARQRQQTVDETDRDGDEDGDGPRRGVVPSDEAVAKLTDYEIPYINDEHAEVATRHAGLKLAFRLLGFAIQTEDAEELQWVVPASIVPSVLRERLDVVDRFLENPIELEGKKASEMLCEKPRRRRRRRSPSLGSDAELPDDEPRRRKKEKKAREEKKYKSAQFIEDSDGEDGAMEAFLEREKALREKAARAAAESGRIATMGATGTKKRRNKGAAPVVVVVSDASNSDEEMARSLRRSRSPTPPPRPKPRVVQKRKADPVATIDISSDSEEVPTTADLGSKKGRLVLSDDEV